MLCDAIVAIAGKGNLLTLDVAYAVHNMMPAVAEEHDIVNSKILTIEFRERSDAYLSAVGTHKWAHTVTLYAYYDALPFGDQ